MYFDSAAQAWCYMDTEQPVADAPDRQCGFCGLGSTPEGHDGCLGALPGVMNACCGHGRQKEAYVQFNPDARISGTEALNWIMATTIRLTVHGEDADEMLDKPMSTAVKP
ncbi:hypothetical protein LCGC14_0413410 [marine sediment metagenome]|uniref:Uncharacterized protein n=1 Tax=marine sediment metagenome TaxID=412755 RepID=A0A0F9SZ08_9ZZZZ